MLWEVAVIEKPTVVAEQGGATEKLVFGPVAVCAKDKDSAIAVALANASVTWKPEWAEVLVRPFVG